MPRKRKLYLFQYGPTESYAVSTDKTGCNLPKNGHPWLLRADVFEGENDRVAMTDLCGAWFPDLIKLLTGMGGGCPIRSSINA